MREEAVGIGFVTAEEFDAIVRAREDDRAALSAMAEIVNLRQARKRKRRADKEERGRGEPRVQHGRSEGESRRGRKRERALDASGGSTPHRRERGRRLTRPRSGMIRKRSVMLQGHATSVSLEDEYWAELKRMAAKPAFRSAR